VKNFVSPSECARGDGAGIQTLRMLMAKSARRSPSARTSVRRLLRFCEPRLDRYSLSTCGMCLRKVKRSRRPLARAFLPVW
jgi:hypothetical protein